MSHEAAATVQWRMDPDRPNCSKILCKFSPQNFRGPDRPNCSKIL